MLAVAFEHDHAQTLRAAERIERGEQPVDHGALIGVVHFGPVQRHGCDATRVNVPDNRTIWVASHFGDPSRLSSRPSEARAGNHETLRTMPATSGFQGFPDSRLRRLP